LRRTDRSRVETAGPHIHGGRPGAQMSPPRAQAHLSPGGSNAENVNGMTSGTRGATELERETWRDIGGGHARFHTFLLTQHVEQLFNADTFISPQLTPTIPRITRINVFVWIDGRSEWHYDPPKPVVAAMKPFTLTKASG
jgi:hypothetical protein